MSRIRIAVMALAAAGVLASTMGASASCGHGNAPVYSPRICTHVSGSTHHDVPCPTSPPATPLPTPRPLPASHPAVPANATGFCHDGTYTTLRSPQGKAEQCTNHGGVAEG